jgi:hypothetical protein
MCSMRIFKITQKYKTGKFLLPFNSYLVQLEVRRLLGYINPVRTSQETHYVSTTELNQLMLCKI